MFVILVNCNKIEDRIISGSFDVKNYKTKQTETFSVYYDPFKDNAEEGFDIFGFLDFADIESADVFIMALLGGVIYIIYTQTKG